MLPGKSMPASIDFYQKLGFSVEQRRDDWGWAMLRRCLLVDLNIPLGAAGNEAYINFRATSRPADAMMWACQTRPSFK